LNRYIVEIAVEEFAKNESKVERQVSALVGEGNRKKRKIAGLRKRVRGISLFRY